MPEPFITIGITCYKEGDWLLECWQSVLEQTDDRWEAVIVMDGGASQRTREIFNSLDHPKLRKYKMPTNSGPYPVRNKAFELTRTLYHFYLDGDDQLLPNSVELVLNAFISNLEIGIVYGDYVYFGLHNGISCFQKVITAESFLMAQPIPGPCAYRKDIWVNVGGFATELARGNGDYDFHIGAFQQNVISHHLGCVFYKYRIGHTTKVSSSYKNLFHESARIIVKRQFSFFSAKRRKIFLANAYQVSAIANRRAGNQIQAMRWAFMSMVYGNFRSQKTWNIFGRPGRLLFRISSRINLFIHRNICELL